MAVAGDSFDLIIAGGGMVGASLAQALVGSGLRIAVIEAWPASSERQPSYDDRAIALAWGSHRILEGVGAWPALAGEATPIRHIHVSDRGHFGVTRLEASELGVDALGYVVTGRTLGAALLERLSGADERVALLCPAVLHAFESDQQGVRVWVDQEGERRTLHGRLLVAADGVQSSIRRQLAIGVREWRYGQSALISNLSVEQPVPNTAFERFTAHGPIALLPFGGNRYGLVWTLLEAAVDEVLALDEAAFLERLQDAFGHRLGRLVRAGRRGAYPLTMVRAEAQYANRVVLIGNAAHALHPITGQGFNLGIRDVAVLADLVHDAVVAGGDIGSEQLLRAYAEWRQRDQQTVALVTDGLVRLFTNPLPPLCLARNLGLLATDLAPAAKRALSRQFMGLGGRLPRLARGLALD